MLGPHDGKLLNDKIRAFHFRSFDRSLQDPSGSQWSLDSFSAHAKGLGFIVLTWNRKNGKNHSQTKHCNQDERAAKNEPTIAAVLD